jgi:hypothetical protein
MICVPEDVTKEILVGVISSLIVVFLGIAWGHGKRMFAAWQTRPTAQAKRESEMEAARRIAGNTQRLVCLVGFFYLAGDERHQHDVRSDHDLGWVFCQSYSSAASAACWCVTWCKHYLLDGAA